MRRTSILRAAVLVVLIALLAGGGVLLWRFLHPSKTTVATKPSTRHKASTPAPLPPLPANAPKMDAGLDPAVDYPFAKRLAQVNTLAHRIIVTNAEYHDNDGGQRYFTAVVTSCKELNQIWNIKHGVLAAKVEGPLRLKDDFASFAFVEYYSQGQWGLSPCESIAP